MIPQTYPGLRPELQHFGCAFTSLAYFRERYQGKSWSKEELQSAWDGAIKTGIITGDLNKNGKLGDVPEELVIQNWQTLADYLGCAVQFLGRFAPGAPEREGAFCIAAWYNPRTKFTHFVVGDTKPVEFDPIAGGSVTVREGAVQSLRLFRPLVALA